MKILLKEVMERKGVTVYALAKCTGIAPNNLARLIKGETCSVKFANIDTICECLDVSIEEIFQPESTKPDQNTSKS